MALFTARPRRAGTKGATPAAVQYIPHAEWGLVPEPWAKSTVPLALSDGGGKGGGRAQHGGEAAYVGVDAGSPSGLQKPPRSFGGVASRKRIDFTALPDGVFGFSCHRSDALSDRVLLFKCPFEVGVRKVTTLVVTAVVDEELQGDALKTATKTSSRGRKAGEGTEEEVRRGSEMDDEWMECEGLNFFDAGLHLRSPVCLCGRAVTITDNDADKPYLPIHTFSTGQTVALRWVEQQDGVDLDQYPSLQRSRAAGHP
ncbi:hypothetical protein QQF64_029620 [Cirrhinus molitorella]|uniref:Uncharacterized protein n=1 Tax=Cirrhinus molitorella TaxID=172907 RepID=A0ABR3N155_9TELE